MEHQEEWRVVPGYPSYHVSSTGRIRSFKRKNPIELSQVPTSGYLRVLLYDIHKNRFLVTVHSVVASAFLIKPEGDLIIDHIDRNKLNNSASNLRYVTHRQNGYNKNIDKTSTYIGVCLHKRRERWTAYIELNGKKHGLGYFVNEEDAARAYDVALVSAGLQPVNFPL